MFHVVCAKRKFLLTCESEEFVRKLDRVFASNFVTAETFQQVLHLLGLDLRGSEAADVIKRQFCACESFSGWN